jgi:hypothetical protein
LQSEHTGRLRALIILFFFVELSCNNTKPLVKNKFENGYFQVITKLNFDIIATTNDTTWHRHFNELIQLMKAHKEMTTWFRTYLGNASTLPDERKSDYLTLLKIIDYFKSQGIALERIVAFAGGNSIGNLNIDLQPMMWEKEKIQLQENIVKKYKSKNYVLIWKVGTLN